MRWAVELGRIDILTEISLLLQYQEVPRQGHLEALYLVVYFLKQHPNKRVVFHPNIPNVDETQFNSGAEWMEFYGVVVEEDPPHMPEPLGRPVKVSCFVDSDHAGNVVTRRSHTGIVICKQCTNTSI